MKSTHRTALTLYVYISILFSPSVLVAQPFPSLYFSEATAVAGETVRIDLLTDNFLNIGSVQFTITWDTSVLQLQAVKDLGFDPSLPENFNEDLFEEGTLIFVEFNDQGLNIDNGNTLFAMDFEVVGAIGDSTTLAFSDAPSPPEFIQLDSDTTVLDITDSVQFQSRVITVSEVNSINEQLASTLQLTVAPNPFAEEARVSWYQRVSGPVSWMLTNELGQRINQGNYTASAGAQYITVRLAEAMPSGTYYFNLQTAKQTVSQKLLCIKP